MDSNEILSETQERECREADARDRDADTTGEDDEKVLSLLGFHFEEAPEAEYVSTERVVVSYPNGYDDTTEEVEDERDCEIE